MGVGKFTRTPLRSSPDDRSSPSECAELLPSSLVRQSSNHRPAPGPFTATRERSDQSLAERNSIMRAHDVRALATS